MGFKSVWNEIADSVKEQIFADARETTVNTAANKWSKEVGLSPQSISQHVKRHMRLSKVRKTIPGTGKQESNQRELSEYEKKFIDDLRTGKKDAEDVARYILANYMENVFRNPELIKSIDAFRVEVLKLKKQEQKDRQSRAMMLVSMMFNGQIPPAHCPRCGEQIYSVSENAGTLTADAIDAEVEETT